MPEKIKLNLFTNYTGDAQYSMLSYAAQLEKSLKSYFTDKCQTAILTPKETAFGKIIKQNFIGKKLDSYWCRFISHPAIARKVCCGINHITDHNNSYLIRYLDSSRTVVTCHDLVYFRMPDKKVNDKFFSPRHAIRKYTVSGLKKAARIIADSENTKRDIIELLGVPYAKIAVIPPGIRPCFNKIEDAYVLNKERKRLGFDWNKTVLHVGTNSYYKNVDAVIHALKILHERAGKDIHFVKVGKDFSPKQKDFIIKSGIEGHVHYMGNLNDNDLNLVYNLSDILVFPSLYEGFGWPPLEAMACGMPVVCSSRGSLGEVVGNSATLIEPCDYKGIAEAIMTLMSDPNIRQSKIEQGFNNIKRFDWKKMAEEVLAIYQEIERASPGEKHGIRKILK